MEGYTWSVTPRTIGTFTYLNATSSTSRFPEIQFNGYDSFLVKVIYQNNCSPKSDSQWIVYDQPITANAGLDIAVCYNASAVNLSGSSSGPRDSLVWSLSQTGSGTFNNKNIINPIYTFSVNDKVLLKDTMILSVYVRQPSACTNTQDTVIVTINPRNFGRDTSTNICSGSTAIYSPESSVTGSSFSWTSSVVYGTVTGRTASGTGNITDNLVCTTPTNDSAVVQYTITPTANSCIGEPYIYKVTIYPNPSLTVNPISQSICSFQSTNLALSSNVPYATFSWVWNPAVPQVTGGSNQTNQTLTAIQQILTNASTINQNATYTITANGKGSCNSSSQVATVTISAAPTISQAGRDTILCNQTAYTLLGNTPTSGSPTWSQIGVTPNLAGGLPSNAITANATSLISGTYQFEYTISSGIMGCPASKDTVTITNRPAVTTSNAGADTAYCEYNEVLPINYTLRANSIQPFENGSWTIVSQPDILNNPASLSSTTNPNAVLTLTKSGTYVLRWTISNDGNCPTSSSQVTIRVFPVTNRG
ncbi:MAG: PKD-like domain-containing protein, partial [Dolichospermum sp.]